MTLIEAINEIAGILNHVETNDKEQYLIRRVSKSIVDTCIDVLRKREMDIVIESAITAIRQCQEGQTVTKKDLQSIVSNLEDIMTQTECHDN